VRVAAPGARSAAAANRVLSDAGSLLSPEAGGGGGATGGLQLDVALQYDRGCRRAHASHLSVPIVQPFRWVSMLWWAAAVDRTIRDPAAWLHQNGAHCIVLIAVNYAACGFRGHAYSPKWRIRRVCVSQGAHAGVGGGQPPAGGAGDAHLALLAACDHHRGQHPAPG